MNFGRVKRTPEVTNLFHKQDVISAWLHPMETIQWEFRKRTPISFVELSERGRVKQLTRTHLAPPIDR